MRYSFTQPLPKSIISRLTKVWVFYIALSVGIVYLYGIYLNLQKYALRSNMNLTEMSIDSSDSETAQVTRHIERLKYEANLYNLNKTYTDELRIALTKLFDLIPDQITITQITLEENRLVLKGITPSREIYSFLLASPLKSVFTTSSVNYFPLPNGWYNFTSISTLKSEQ